MLTLKVKLDNNSQNKKSTIQISEKLWNYLVKTYKIRPNSNQWIYSENALNEFSFEVERFFNSTDFCCIKRFLNYFDQNQVFKKKPFKHSLTFKFQCLSLENNSNDNLKNRNYFLFYNFTFNK
jgi:hypothetical protein